VQRQREVQIGERHGRIDDRHAVGRVRTVQLEHQVEQRILGPLGTRWRRLDSHAGAVVSTGRSRGHMIHHRSVRRRKAKLRFDAPERCPRCGRRRASRRRRAAIQQRITDVAAQRAFEFAQCPPLLPFVVGVQRDQHNGCERQQGQVQFGHQPIAGG
jgi:hypothetical protein